MSDTSLPSSTTFNALVEMMAEKLYPKKLEISTMSSSEFTIPNGTATFEPLSIKATKSGGNNYYYSTVKTVYSYQCADYNTLTIRATGTGATNFDAFVQFIRKSDNVDVATLHFPTLTASFNYSESISTVVDECYIIVQVGGTQNSIITFAELSLS